MKRIIVWRFVGLYLAAVLGISQSVAQRLLLIEPSIQGTIGFDIQINPQCVNDRGHAAGILEHVDAQNRRHYYPFIWTPENGMILLPEPTMINDRGNMYTINLYGARVLNLSNSGQLLMRLETDYLGFVLVGWSSATGYRVIRSEYGELFNTVPCMPINLLSSQFILSFSDFLSCGGDGYYDDERRINCPSQVSITFYPFDYNTMNFNHQGSYEIPFLSVFQDRLIFFGVFTAMSQSGNALVGQIIGSGLSHPFRIYKNPTTQQWQGDILHPNSSAYGIATAVSADGLFIAGNRRRPDNRYLPFLWYFVSGQNAYGVIDIDPPSRQNFTPNVVDVIKITADGRMIVGTATQRDNGNIVISKAYQWTSNRGVEYLEEKYAGYIPDHFSFPFVIDISSDGRYMLLKVENSCAGYGVLDTQGEPMYPDNPIVIMRNETAPADAPDSRHAYPYVGDQITLAALVKYNQIYYFNYPACANLLTFGRWYVPGHHYLSGGGERSDFSFSHVRYNMPARISQWSGPALRFEWYRTRHMVDEETSLSRFRSGYMYVPNQYVPRLTYGRYSLQGRIHHSWYLYALDHYPPDGLWVRNIAAQGCGTYRYCVRCPAGGRNGRCWIGLHQPKPGPWRDPSQDESVFNDCFSLLYNNSQNCDEADELAIRLSIRVVADWINDSELRRKLVEWASSFVNVPYEWGGHWYGGRADNDVQFVGAYMNVRGQNRRIYYPGSVGYQGYGVDCSGLVSAAARLAGYSDFQTSDWRRSASELADDEVSDPVSIHRIQPGHIIVQPGEHVAIVYNVINRSLINPQEQKWRIDIEYIDTCIMSGKVDIHSVTIEGIEGESIIRYAYTYANDPRRIRAVGWMVGAQIRALEE